MVALLLGVIGKLCTWFADVLPVSPFASLLPTVDPVFSTGIAWLNTFVPVGQIVTLIGAWGASFIAYLAVKLFKKFTVDKLISVIDVS